MMGTIQMPNKEDVILEIANELVRITNEFHKIIQVDSVYGFNPEQLQSFYKGNETTKDTVLKMGKILEESAWKQMRLSTRPPFGDDNRLKDFFIEHLEKNDAQGVLCYCDYYLQDNLFKIYSHSFVGKDDEFNNRPEREQEFYNSPAVSEEAKTAYSLNTEIDNLIYRINNSLCKK